MPRRSPKTDGGPRPLSLPGLEQKGDPARELADALGPGSLVGGLDEVGRGPLAGPVVAAAVVLDRWHGIRGLNDSKALLAEERDALYPTILEAAAAVGVGVVEAEEIDRLNILRASLEAMRRAFAQCEERLGEPIRAALVDGNMRAPLPQRVVQQPVIQGDGRSQPIMAASIVAKVERDRRMVDEAERWPAYGFEQHKGYATPAHREALFEAGPCPLHRRSFAPVREACVLHGLLPPEALRAPATQCSLLGLTDLSQAEQAAWEQAEIEAALLEEGADALGDEGPAEERP